MSKKEKERSTSEKKWARKSESEKRSATNKKDNQKRSTWGEWARSLGVVLGISLLLRGFIAEAYVVPSGSMLPTLKVGDRIFANRFVYGLKVPWVEYKLTHGRSPKPGEVIIFVDPRGSGDTLVKRVAATGGDTIAIKNGIIYRNGKPIKRRPLQGEFGYLEQVEGSDRSLSVACDAFEEESSGNRYRVFYHRGHLPYSFGPVKVPRNHVFVLGDNRDNSNDSRFWGTVPHSHIKGQMMFIFWSHGHPDGVRTDRIFTWVH
jgi:signal peptidase I